MTQPAYEHDASQVLTWEEISHLASEGGKPADTLMNVVDLIARRFQTDVCSAYLLEPDRVNLVLRQIRQRMIENLVDAVDVFDVVKVAPVVDDGADLLAALHPAQLASDAGRQLVPATKGGVCPAGGLEL